MCIVVAPDKELFAWFQDIADIYEKEENVEKAMEYYDKAAELYSGEGTDSTANQCKIKVAQFAAQLEQWASILLLSTSFLLSIVCAAGWVGWRKNFSLPHRSKLGTYCSE